jgi:hypothetical protein
MTSWWWKKGKLELAFVELAFWFDVIWILTFFELLARYQSSQTNETTARLNANIKVTYKANKELYGGTRSNK